MSEVPLYQAVDNHTENMTLGELITFRPSAPSTFFWFIILKPRVE